MSGGRKRDGGREQGTFLGVTSNFVPFFESIEPFKRISPLVKHVPIQIVGKLLTISPRNMPITP
jgi:hypothetical protein